MKKTLNLTIVTVNYDNLLELEKTLLSVDSQTIRPKKHIIVSKKLSLNDIKKFKKKYRKFILGKDTSIFNAMNIGKKFSDESILMFLNSGDYFVNKKSIQLIEKYKNYLIKNKVLIFKTILVNLKEYFYPKKLFFLNSNHLPHSSFIFYNSKKNKKINFDERMVVTADGKWMKEIIEKSNGLIRVFRNLVYQNLDGQSSTPSPRTIKLRFNENIWSGIKEILKLIIRYFVGKNLYFKLIYINKYNY